MVDFNKLLEISRTRGKFLGYCNFCDTFGRLYEKDIIPSYKDLPEKEQKVICPNCKKYQLRDDLIPF